MSWGRDGGCRSPRVGIMVEAERMEKENTGSLKMRV